MGLAMKTSTNVQMSSTNKIMLTHLQEDERQGGEKTWVYSYKT
jgi:hypothetical protein